MFFRYFSPKRIGAELWIGKSFKRSDQAGAANRQHFPRVMAPCFDLLANSRGINTLNGAVRRIAPSLFPSRHGNQALGIASFRMVWSQSRDMKVSARGCFTSTVCSQAHHLLLDPKTETPCGSHSHLKDMLRRCSDPTILPIPGSSAVASEARNLTQVSIDFSGNRGE
jgi:hypothetical protein